MKKPLDPNKIELLDEAEVERYRKMTPAEKMVLMNDLNREHRHKVAEEIRVRYPAWSETQVSEELSRTLLAGACSNWYGRPL